MLNRSIFRRRFSWTVHEEQETTEINKKSSGCSHFLRVLGCNWRLLVTVLVPFLLLPIPLCWTGQTGKEPWAAYTILVMGLYWMTECIPLPITSFLPVVCFPMFGIMSSDKVAQPYLQDSILFMFGGCVIALSFEYCNLHTRIALKVIMVVGARIAQLMLGIMMTTMFLSMWMNNTSTTAMMVPIVSAIMEELKTKMIENMEKSDTSLEETANDDGDISTSVVVPKVDPKNMSPEVKRLHEKIKDIKTMFLLATAYSSNIGGTGVITGSGTNVIALDLVRKDAEEQLASPECRQLLEISFLDWMMFNVPPMLLNTIFCWIYLQIYFLGIPRYLKFWNRHSKEEDETEKLNATLEKSVTAAMTAKYKELGTIRFEEIGILILFVIVVILWIFKDPQIIPGWDSLPFFARTPSGKSFIKECTPTLLICVLMFAIPGKAEYYKNWKTGGLGEGLNDPLLSFKFIHEKFPWGIFMLLGALLELINHISVLGGGSAMALGAKESGLNKWMEKFLENSETLQSLPGPIILLVILFLIAILTSVASNTACAAIVTPVLLGLSYVKKMHPLYMVYAATTVCSYAFVLPVSTPPNAIVYTSSDLKLTEMMKPGFIVNIVCIGVLFLTTHTTSYWIFNFGGYNDECKDMAHLGASPVMT